jgi:ABC-type microcin C transport system duplicated ATPase subunit YejF
MMQLGEREINTRQYLGWFQFKGASQQKMVPANPQSSRPSRLQQRTLHIPFFFSSAGHKFLSLQKCKKKGSKPRMVQVGDLSGGERNRLQLACTLKEQGNLLLLDEPTNDLDVDTLRALEDAILKFAGCAVIISHDRYFLDRVATHILAFEVCATFAHSPDSLKTVRPSFNVNQNQSRIHNAETSSSKGFRV